MKKLIFCILIVFLATASVYAEKPVTTVLDFEINSVSKNDMKSIISFLSASLYDTGKYRVIDTAQRDTILSELEFSLSGCTDDSCQLEIGKLLSAEYIVTGNIALVGSRYILTARMLETETSETKGTAKGIYANLDAMIDDMPVFAESLAGIEQPAAAEEEIVEEAAAEPAAEQSESSGERERSSETGIGKTVGGGNVLAWSTLGAGAAMLGTGTYFLVDSILKINAVNDAEAAYMSAESDFESAYNNYLTAFEAAGSSNAMFWVGAGLIGGGVISTVVSMILFSDNSADADSSIAVALGPKSVAVRLSY